METLSAVLYIRLHRAAIYLEQGGKLHSDATATARTPEGQFIVLDWGMELALASGPASTPSQGLRIRLLGEE